MAQEEMTALPTDEELKKWGMANKEDPFPYERARQNLKETQEEFEERTAMILNSIKF